MKAALVIAFAATRVLAQPAPDCAYTLAHSRPGALAVFRNEKLLQPSDYTRSGTLGRTVTLNGWNDGDKITYSYPFASDITISGTVIRIWISTLEYRTCSGTLNPPPKTITATRKICSGSGTRSDGTKWDCAGIEEWVITLSDGTVRYYFAVASQTQPPNIVDCPATSPDPQMGCFTPVALNDARAPAKYHAAYIQVVPE